MWPKIIPQIVFGLIRFLRGISRRLSISLHPLRHGRPLLFGVFPLRAIRILSEAEWVQGAGGRSAQRHFLRLPTAAIQALGADGFDGVVDFHHFTVLSVFTHLTSGNNTPGAVPVLVIDAERSDARVMGFTVQYSAFDKEGSTIYP